MTTKDHCPIANHIDGYKPLTTFETLDHHFMISFEGTTPDLCIQVDFHLS